VRQAARDSLSDSVAKHRVAEMSGRRCARTQLLHAGASSSVPAMSTGTEAIAPSRSCMPVCRRR
jgi:hypothetical protein